MSPSYAIVGAADMSTGTDAAVRIHRTEQIKLAALVSSASYSRLFVRQVLASWQLDQERLAVAELLVSELVSNAVTASGVTEPRPLNGLPCADLRLIGIRLLALDDSLVIEVWDTSPQPPRLMNPTNLSEHGRGLQLVDALSIRWGYYSEGLGGKVVWCQLALKGTGLQSPTEDDAEASQAVLAALQSHPWDEHA